jgi:diacylglycerol kinase
MISLHGLKKFYRLFTQERSPVFHGAISFKAVCISECENIAIERSVSLLFNQKDTINNRMKDIAA